MPDTKVASSLRPSSVRRGMVRAYRHHAERTRQRREHDDAMTLDPRFATEHRMQIFRSIDSGRGDSLIG